jgi:hypothetical protein
LPSSHFLLSHTLIFKRLLLGIFGGLLIHLFRTICVASLFLFSACGFFGAKYSMNAGSAGTTSALSGPAFQLSLSGPSSAPLGSCVGPYLIETKDAEGRPSAAVDSQLKFLVSDSSGAKIYLESGCADSSLSANGEVPVNSDGVSGTFYLSGVRASTATLLARMDEILASQLPVTYVPGEARGVRWIGSPVISAFSCVETSIEMIDATGTVTQQTDATSVNIGPSDLTGVTLHSSATCRTPATQISFLRGESSKKVWVFASNVGAFGLRATAPSLLPGQAAMTALNSNSPKLVISPAMENAVSNECRVFTIHSVTSAGQPLIVRTDTPVSLSGAETQVLVYANETCQGTPTRTLGITADTDQTKFSTKAAIASSYSLTASANLFVSGMATLNVRGGAPTLALFSAALSEVRANQCAGPFRIQLRDAAGNNTTVAAALPIALSGSEPGQATFFEAPDCSTSPVTAVPVPAQQGTATFYLKASRPGSLTIAAEPTNLSPATQRLSVLNTQGYPRSLAWEEISVVPFKAGRCINLKLKSLDANGFPSEIAGSDLALLISSDSNSTQIFSGQDCANANTFSTIAIGASETKVSVFETVAKEITLSALDSSQAQNILSATKRLTIEPERPAQLVFEGTVSPASFGQCYSIVIGLKDVYGNLSPWTSPIQINLDNSGAFSFHANCTSNDVAGSASFPAGSTRIIVAYRAKTSGMQRSLIAIGPTGIAAARSSIDVLAPPPTHLSVLGDRSVIAGSCAPYQIVSLDPNDQPALFQDLRATLSISSLTGVFFSDSACSTGITSLDMSPSKNPVDFYFRSTVATPGAVVLNVTDSSGGAYSTPISVLPGSATSLVLSNEGPSSVLTGRWVGPYRASLRDLHGNAAVARSIVPLHLVSVAQGVRVAKLADGSGGNPIILLNGSHADFYLFFSEAGERYPLSLNTEDFVSNQRQIAVRNPGAMVSSLDPSSGLGGDVVTLTGGPFLTGVRVQFGLADCLIQTFSSTRITCTVPAGTGVVPVVVTNPSADPFILEPGFAYRGAAPTVGSLSPNDGPAAGGTVVTISGANFRAGATVTLGGSACAVSSLSATSLVCTTSAHAMGSVDAVITNSDGASGSKGSAFNYQGAAPTIASLSPNYGPVAGGTVVTLSGNELQNGSYGHLRWKRLCGKLAFRD